MSTPFLILQDSMMIINDTKQLKTFLSPDSIAKIEMGSSSKNYVK